MAAVTLHGYHYSVYARIAKLVCREKGIGYDWVEIDPFADPPDPRLPALNPFGRVPILDHQGFRLYETQAIARYLDEAFDGPSLQPGDPKARARAAQIGGIVDNHGYWPMVRQVFSHAVFAPAEGRPGDPRQVEAGLGASETVLAALEAIAADDAFLTGPGFMLADAHLAPMMAAFTAAPRAMAVLDQHSRLAGWWARIRTRRSLVETDPGLPAGL